MTSPKRYWMTLVERDGPSALQPEFPVHPEHDLLATRRTFLKAAGFSFAGLMAASCRPAPQHALPHILQPELTPGRGYVYASTCRACEARCGLLVTTRDGRPTKIEGNPDHPLSGGATCAVGQASILGLYDSHRLAHPLRNRARATWADVDVEMSARLAEARASGAAVRLLTGTVTSPTTAAVIDAFVGSFPNGRHDQYDPISASATLDAYALTHGAPMLPHYRFDRADLVVSFDADFLGTWISPVEFARAYAARRRMSESEGGHVQIESRLSLTGSKADVRLCVAPDDIGQLANHLAARIARLSGEPVDWQLEAPPVDPATLDRLAHRLWSARGRALVVSGSQDVRAQIVCNFINELLGSYGTTIDRDRPTNQRRGRDSDLETLRGELTRGEVAVLIVAGVNPAYELPDRQTFVDDLARVPLLVSVAEQLDETASLAHVVCPDHHYLESWDDAEPVAGVVSLAQPTIHPLNDTRAFIETLATWTGAPRSAYDLIRQHWERAIYPRAGTTDPYPTFWDRTLERGVTEVSPEPSKKQFFNRGTVQPIARRTADTNALALVLYAKVGMLDGRHAHNPWLHELPDPVTKVTWDNYACLSPAIARRLNVADGDVVRVSNMGSAPVTLELPAFVQPGQHDGIVAIALGYGRAGTDRFTTVGPPWIGARPPQGPVGENAAPFITVTGGTRRYDASRVEITRTGRSHRLASTQLHHSLTVPGAAAPFKDTGGSIIQETTPGASGNQHQPHEGHRELWPEDHKYEGHRWGMAIDLDSCTGCSACVIACQVENNIPVVGYDEVSRHREMHWLRIDRYYSGDDRDITVAHQPMLCQHCEHAPCETVCPTLATVHSSEGLNEQVYNRCVGTRYCANNCPYKVRRFNWFDYPRADSRQNLVLNPNVTVRSRGVMEKCTFCVQRIEEARSDARHDGRPITDGAIQTACQQTCPSEAIVFGDLNDPNSRVSRLSKSRRAYRVLEEINTRPAVRYLQIIRRGTAESVSD
jgi:Fe-S-cluster-containing dehydrogenase component/anaerobic selenocysteine-containing dehydrogenase